MACRHTFLWIRWTPPRWSSSVLAVAAVVAAVLIKLGVVRWVLHVVGVVVRTVVRWGFEVWKRCFSWADWPRFLAVVLALLALGWAAGLEEPWVAVLSGAALLFTGVAACLAFMFIDLERYEVGRGYKAVHNPLKGQQLAFNLDPVRPPRRSAAADGRRRRRGRRLRHAQRGPVSHHRGGLVQPRRGKAADVPRFPGLPARPSSPHRGPDGLRQLAPVPQRDLRSPGALAGVVAADGFQGVLHPGAAATAVRLGARGKVLSETIAEFWSPHEPIAERARLSLPQHGVGAVRPLLASLRSIEFLTKEQRDQLPRVMADIGPSALPTLTAHLHDSHENVRAVAAGAVGCLHDLDALPALVRLRRDPSEWVRESLVEALGKIGGANGSKVAQTEAVARPRPRRPSRLMAWVIGESVGAARDAAALIDLAVSTLRGALADSATAVRTQAARRSDGSARRLPRRPRS